MGCVRALRGEIGESSAQALGASALSDKAWLPRCLIPTIERYPLNVDRSASAVRPLAEKDSDLPEG
jgi:hypothetical protein